MTTRRRFLTGAGVLAASSLAGCLDGGDPSSAGEAQRSAYASFFTLAEFTRAVGGDALAVENAVPAGEHGHEWEPRATLLPELVESDAFVYLDVDGFQPWAEGAAAQVAENHADDVVLIDALEGISLRRYDGADDPVGELLLVDAEAGGVVADYHVDHWHGGLGPIPVGESLTIEPLVRDQDGAEIPVGDGERHRVDARLAGDDIVRIEASDDRVDLHGEAAGATTVVFELRRDGDLEWASPPIGVSVGDDHETPSSDSGHSHGEYDAKFFTDPVLAQDGVRNVRDGLVELDPANEDAYERNADAYLEELAELHRRYEEGLADRDHDVVVLAGHDSFGYLGARYGFEIHTPVGLSPDHEPTPAQLAAAIELVDDHGLEYVLWDYFDGPRAAEVIATEADGNVEPVMVSPAESTTEEWGKDGYGDYLGQMLELNLPAFQKALGAT